VFYVLISLFLWQHVAIPLSGSPTILNLELTIHDFVFSTYVHIISPLLKGSLELKAILLSDEFTSF